MRNSLQCKAVRSSAQEEDDDSFEGLMLRRRIERQSKQNVKSNAANWTSPVQYVQSILLLCKVVKLHHLGLEMVRRRTMRQQQLCDHLDFLHADLSIVVGV